jgi:periplasmic copper chaperone A
MIRSIIAGAALAALVLPAAAHVTLETQEAKIGSSYKAVLRVPHGCEGTATTTVRVKIPDGVIGVKPMPKPGWTISTSTGKYGKTYDYFHAKLSEGVTEISWSGGKLPDAWYDEFVFQGFLATDLEPGTSIYFPVVQECEKGVHRWIEIPAPGKSGSDYPEPAPVLKLVPAAGPRH